MSEYSRWGRCTQHRGENAEKFLQTFFSEQKRKCLLILGGGFDPRACVLPRLLAQVCSDRIQCVIFKEERIQTPAILKEYANEHTKELETLYTNSTTCTIDLFTSDNAVVGGRTAVSTIKGFVNKDFTDIVIDISALSIGVSFPTIRYLLEYVEGQSLKIKKIINLHLIVSDDPSADSAIVPVASTRVGSLFGFSGRWQLDENRDAVKLWLPQLGKNQAVKEAFQLIYDQINPEGVCPILPLSQSTPRLVDDLLWFFHEEIDNLWKVDSRDLVYAHESLPLDLYRTILKIDKIRRKVFRNVGGSIILLSPVGKKMLAIGILLAALDRDFPVIRVESIGYDVDKVLFEKQYDIQSGDIAHIWLFGEATISNQGMED